MTVLSDALQDVIAMRAARVAAGTNLIAATAAQRAAKDTFEQATLAFSASRAALLLIIDPTGP